MLGTSLGNDIGSRKASGPTLCYGHEIELGWAELLGVRRQ